MKWPGRVAITGRIKGFEGQTTAIPQCLDRGEYRKRTVIIESVWLCYMMGGGVFEAAS